MSVPPRVFRFQRLLNLTEQLAEQAKQQLRRLGNQRQAKQKRLQQLTVEIQRTSDPQERVGSLSSMQAWKSCSLYVTRLQTLVRVEQDVLAKLEEAYQHALSVYLQRRRRLKSLELLRDKQETLRQQYAERRQQLEMDDFVLARTESVIPENE